jgi:hypothetical protein
MPSQEIRLSPQQRRTAIQVLEPREGDIVFTYEATLGHDDFAAPIWSRIHANMAESRTFAEIRDTLLPKLLSGELRVKDAEVKVGAVL